MADQPIEVDRRYLLLRLIEDASYGSGVIARYDPIRCAPECCYRASVAIRTGAIRKA